MDRFYTYSLGLALVLFSICVSAQATADQLANLPIAAQRERLAQRASVPLDVLSDVEVQRLSDYESWALQHSGAYRMISAPCLVTSGDPVADRAYLAALQATRDYLDAEVGDLPVSSGFRIRNRWTASASNPSSPARGDSITLTWSYLPDGSDIREFVNATRSFQVTGQSSFIATFNALIGAPTVPGDFTTAPWHQLFVNAFNDWSNQTGLTVVYEPNDDAASFPFAGGERGVRGDLRIGGKSIDGQNGSNTLAYNYFPSLGDMVIDTDNTGFYGQGFDNDGVFNVLAHELGHGLGYNHVVPVNETKLMEPFISFAFRGPQEDDILAGNRNYGDNYEADDTEATSFSLGVTGLGSTVVIPQRSIDGANDVDFTSFTVNNAVDFSVTLTPKGTTYLEGPQNPDDGAPAPFNALTQNDLQFQILPANGASSAQAISAPVFTANATGAGQPEVAQVTLQPGAYVIEVSSQSGVDAAQMYELRWTSANVAAPVPVELMSFDIRVVDCEDTRITWTTANELNNDYFEVLRSSDGDTWETIRRVAAAGAGDYLVNDASAVRGTHYYRLVQHDLDGAETAFPIVQADGSDCEEALVLSPNPSSGGVTVNGLPVSVETISVYDAAGRLVHQVSANASVAESPNLPPSAIWMPLDQLSLGHLPSGLYRVVARDGEVVISGSIIIR